MRLLQKKWGKLQELYSKGGDLSSRLLAGHSDGQPETRSDLCVIHSKEKRNLCGAGLANQLLNALGDWDVVA